ncbi:MAG: acylphosphatase [Candidatus Omnitrophica bacterium]|jgi:acylphosphatase|nr:acylphosphatase [Candidatus Omnitrophota bacterium]
MEKQLHLFFSGQVQGVGFRFTAVNTANNLNITGWVKNLSDGRVEILAEGEKPVLEDYLNRMRRHFNNYVNDVDIEWLEAGGEFTDFRVIF